MTTTPRGGTAAGPTLEQVAALAGVGRGTASRVINGGDKVSERSRLAVEDAIEQLGYVPNAAARALVKRRTDTVALVIAESEERVFGEPFFAGVVRGIGAALGDADRQLVLVLAQASERRHGLDRYLTRQHVDGVLLPSTTTTSCRRGSAPAASPWSSAAGPRRVRRTVRWTASSTSTTCRAPRSPSPTWSPPAGSGSRRSPGRRTWWRVAPASRVRRRARRGRTRGRRAAGRAR